MGDAFEFRNALGEERMSEYIHNLAVTAGYKLAEMWGTEVFTNDNSTFQAMVTIGLPTNDSTIARAIQQRLLDDYDTMAVFYRFQGALWARLSAQIYLELQDFIDLGKLILELLKESAM
jgi:selenocysteine lyase/cysteine desulfurase